MTEHNFIRSKGEIYRGKRIKGKDRMIDINTCVCPTEEQLKLIGLISCSCTSSNCRNRKQELAILNKFDFRDYFKLHGGQYER